MRKIVVLLFTLLCVCHVGAADLVLFHDSSDAYYYDQSWINVTSPSVVEIPSEHPEKLYVSTDLKKDGDNSLRLSWNSKEGGNWKALVAGLNWDVFRLDGYEKLTFWMYATEPMTPEMLPDVTMESHYDGECGRLKLSDYVENVVVNEWMKVEIPICDFRFALPDFVGFNTIKGVFFHQSVADETNHTLLLDEFRFTPMSDVSVLPEAKISGLWNFDNAADPYAAAVGGNAMSGTGGTFVEGVDKQDGAVLLQSGSENFFKLTLSDYNLGEGERVNEYCMMFDILIQDLSNYRSLFQTDPTNVKDGSLFVRNDGAVGLGGSIGYSASDMIREKEWNRVVVNVRLGKDEDCFVDLYLNGGLIYSGEKQDVDSELFSLGKDVLLFADNNAENGETVVTRFALFKECLTAQEIYAMGGFAHEKEPEMLPHLQAPLSTSMIVNWHSVDYSVKPVVLYGKKADNLENKAEGTNEMIGSHLWNTVKLENLEPGTEYFYKCVSGEYESPVCAFKTPLENRKADKVRLILLSDSQDSDEVTTDLLNRFRKLMEEKYGTDLHNHIDLICHCGDMVSGGGEVDQYENRFFRPFSVLTRNIPIVTVTGNHEVESRYYYSYMKYDDFANGVSGVNPESFYTLNINGVQLLMLNSNTELRIQSQLDWLKTQLEKANADNNIAFSLPFCHHAYCSELWPGGAGYGLTEDTYQGTTYVKKILDVVQPFDKVPALFNGHVHGYERTVLPGKNATGRDFMEITLGGAGGNLDFWGSEYTGPDMKEVKVAMDHYHIALLELDLENETFDGYVYSFGNNNVDKNGEIIDHWYGRLNQAAPEMPEIVSATETEVSLADYKGADAQLSVELQISEKQDFSTVDYELLLDNLNIYGVDSEFTPVNVNADLDLQHIDISDAKLQSGKTYFVRVRYRDCNLKWSDWSQADFSGIEDNLSASDVRITGTPTGVRVNLSDEGKEHRIDIWDISGKNMLMETSVSTSVEYALTEGCYIVVVSSEGQKWIRKIRI